MNDLRTRVDAGEIDFLEERELIDFIVGQRWFGSKSREVGHARILEAPLLREDSPLLLAAVVEIRFHPGTHDIYQVPLGLRPDEDGWEKGVVTHTDGWTVYDAMTDPVLALRLVELMRDSAMVQVGESALGFRAFGEIQPPAVDADAVRPMGAEQSNTSLVFDDQLVLKLYRRLEAGVNPELEMLSFLTERGFPNIPTLQGWSNYWGRLMDATLSILQKFVSGERDGWEMALEALRSDPEGFLPRAERLGQVIGAMHVALASDSHNAAFAPEEIGSESMPLLTARIDEEISGVFRDLPEDVEALEPIRGRGEQVRDHLRSFSRMGHAGVRIRHHGDLHLGQALWSEGDWVVLDFEGEPARTVSERRRKRSPLRDVAGMLRSISYAASASRLDGVDPPADWERRARDAFLEGYLPTVETAGLLPRSQDSIQKLLGLFELEKAVYELRYELNNRPDWVRVPVAGIVSLLELDQEGT